MSTQKTALITGGCGFIGFHVSRLLLSQGWVVAALDDLSRKAAQKNVLTLQQSSRFRLFQGKVQDRAFTEKVVQETRPDLVIHLAGQVAVTFSVADPMNDFENNLLGTLTLLESLRKIHMPQLLVYSSTNKVYGGLEDLRWTEGATRFEWPTDWKGVDESRPVDFHTPYGCSKGASDLYIHDYFRVFQMPTVVLRQSCIYGTHQSGEEDQGWLAWFAQAALKGRTIRIFGNGKQVRDVLWVGDLADLMVKLWDQRQWAAGQVFNVGGGVQNTLSLQELLKMLKDHSLSFSIEYAEPRTGDQNVFVSDNSKALRQIGWAPSVGVQEGLRRMIDFYRSETT